MWNPEENPWPLRQLVYKVGNQKKEDLLVPVSRSLKRSLLLNKDWTSRLVISDTNKFIQFNITPDKYLNYIINVEKKIKKLFRDLLDNDKISKDEYDKICPKGSRPGILYGNPKIHKPAVDNLLKFWPILPVINNPGYNIAKFLIPILEPFTHNEFTKEKTLMMVHYIWLVVMLIFTHQHSIK